MQSGIWRSHLTLQGFRWSSSPARQWHRKYTGIVYTSDAIAAPDLKTIEIPAELNVIAKYPIASLTNSANANLAKAFMDYVLSAEGRATLKKWGFAPAE